MMRASRSFSHVFSFSRESIVRCRCSTSDGSLVTTGTASSATLLSVIIARLSAFDHRRALDIFGGQGLQSFLGFTVRHLVGMPTAFGGLISQIDGALGHGRPLVKAILGQRPKLSLINTGHRPGLSLPSSRFTRRSPHQSSTSWPSVYHASSLGYGLGVVATNQRLKS